MNKETCSAAGSASCPDYFGTLPSCAGLAVPYVPFQQNGSQKYSQGDALSNGTLFPGLNLPFHLKVEGSTLPSNPLVELQALEFVVLELAPRRHRRDEAVQQGRLHDLYHRAGRYLAADVLLRIALKARLLRQARLV